MIYRLIFALLAVCGNASAQGTEEDYRRAFSIPEKFSAAKVMYSDVRPQWISGTHTFWYVRNTPDGRFYVAVDADRKQRRELFSHTRLAKALATATGNDITPGNIPIEHLSVNRLADTLHFVSYGKRWMYAVKRNRLTEQGTAGGYHGRQRHWSERDDEKGAAPAISPDGKNIAFIKENNIYVRPTNGGREIQLSFDGTEGNYYSSYIQWSPDSRKVAACKIRPTEKRYIYYVESSPTDQLQPKLHKQEYAKPGDELPFRIPCVFDIVTGKRLIPETDLFDSQYYLWGLYWNRDSRGVTFEYNQRGHKVYRVLEMSAETGKVRTLIEEKAEKYVNYSRRFRHDLQDGKHIIWMSERDNHNHLYMYDRKTAAPSHQITKGEWYVRDVVRVDEDKRQIYFSANGMRNGEDPYLIYYYRINFDGTGLTCLTPAEGTHKAWLSDDMKYLVDVYSMADKAPVTVLRNTSDSSETMPLETADISRLTAEGWRPPEVFAAKGRDGITDMWGIIIRPTNFDPEKKYPVLEYIYQGPGDQYVPKSFTAYNYFMTGIAELGFIVVMVDGMGTSFRSRDFENVCYRNLKDAGLPDHIAWIKAAAEKYSCMDTSRVGIYGCSAGGQESMAAVLFHPEFYKAAYSACGCHDNRMDKIWWNEQWMGYPVGEQYKENSNVENAHLLTRPLMLVVGEIDDNVDPASTMQVANALIKAGKDFDLVVIPGARHTIGESFGEHKRYDFFVRHLLGKNPPEWSRIKAR
ncbi:S9 family peptidase [Xylanibacter muris]|uniref:Prolyl oligopeptidase family serine peptidase n=1 Tax=Xylanibacter muris TaxID=2736290 RepID=A0ABX2AM75_9BACT|nr:S9 family peptidase [Xylanibacter muris]NPD92124.1 prolyl oligopeptidase family serine peptidase [Xylanibacter muris]